MGWVATIGLNALLGLAGYWTSRYAFQQPRGITRVLAAAVLAWTWATIGLIGLGSFGLLRIEWLFAWTSLGLAIGAGFRIARGKEGDPDPPPGERWDNPAILAVGLLTWVMVTLLAPTIVVPVRIVSDGPIYHLYFAARWWKEQRLFLIASPFGENAATYFPAGGDLWFTWLMISLRGDRLAKIGQAPFLVMGAIAAYGLARRFGIGKSASMIATVWLLTCLPLLIFSFEANVDTIFIAGYLSCVFFLTRFSLRDGDLDALALAGLSAGLAWGTKPTATVFVPILIALGLLAIWRRSGRGSRKLARLGLLLLATAIPAGYWFARNAWLGGGNPLYPLEISAFGRVLLPGWYQSSAMKTSQFYIPIAALGTFAEILLVVFDPRQAPLWLASLAGLWAVGKRKNQYPGWIWACSALVIGNIALYWVFIPYRTQQRFMLQSAGLWVIPLACLLDRGRLLRWLGVLLLAIHLMTPQTWPFAGTPLDGLWDFSKFVPPVTSSPIALHSTLADVQHVFTSTRIGSETRVKITLLAFNASLAMFSAFAWSRSSKAWRAGGWLVAACLLAANLALMNLQVDPLIRRFPIFRDYLRGWVELDGRTRPGTRIAYAGTNLPYCLMGPDLKNDVFYVNINAHPGWLLHDYAKAARSRGEGPWPSPRPGWDRLERDYDAWLDNLRAERIQVLVVCRAKPEDGGFNIADTQWFPIERTWAETHPESFTPVYGVVENEKEIRIYQVHPPIRENSGATATESTASPH